MVILITGTSTGIGYAAAETIARNGHTVYATMRNPQRSPQLQRLAEKDNLPLHVLPLDVLDDRSVENAINHALTKEGHIDVLVNNAGIGYWGALEYLPVDLVKKDMDTNFFGTLRCIQAVLPSMKKRREGTIINVTSVAGKVYFNFFASYCASKAATEALSESLAQELQPFNIRVALVEPGVIETPIFSKVGNDHPHTDYPNMKRFLSFFAASLEFRVQPSVVAEVINDIVSGKTNAFRNPAGPDAPGMLGMRAAASDEDWINSVAITDDEWIDSMEQMGVGVGKYMKAEGLPQFSFE